MKMTLEAKKEFAKLLYTRQQFNGKLVAERVGTTEKTISKWVAEGNWKALRNRLLTSKETQINNFYEQLENLNDLIKKSDSGVPDTKQADVQIKLTSAIKNLEQDLNISETVDAGIGFIKHLQTVEKFEVVTYTADLWNSFILNQIGGK